MASAPTRGPLEPAPDHREVALAARWRRLRVGAPPALFLLGCAAVLAALLVATGWLLSKVVHDDGIGRADSSLSRWLASNRTDDVSDVTRFTTMLADTITITVLAVLTVAVAAWLWRRWREPMLVAVAVAGEVAIFLLVTSVVDRRRPPVGHMDEAPPTSSFPSGHTAAAVVMYGALAVLASERARSALVKWCFVALAVALPLLVASSRLYRGMHYLTDVLGGFLLGGAWLAVTVRGIRLGVAHRRLRHGGPVSDALRSWRRSAARHG